jgi:glycerophosphoryl diester phosphodiesterase
MNRSVVLVDAHRGASAHNPENTLAAFRAAIEAGTDSVEFDVRLSSDGHPVVIHDPTVDRTTDGSGEVAAMPLAALRELDAGSWKDRSFSVERLPTLDEALDVLAEAPRINMELKTEDPAIANAAVAAIEQRRLHHRIMVSSFFLPHLLNVKGRLPGVWTHLFVDEPLFEGFWEDGGQLVNSLGLPFEGVTRSVVDDLHRRGRAVWTFTVDHPETVLRLAALGVQAITTNDPRRTIRVLSGAGYR